MRLFITSLLSLLLSLPAFAEVGKKVAFETTLGRFVITLDEQAAPETVKNFLKYVDDGSYVNSIFHRVIPGFMAQGGGFVEGMKKLPNYTPVKNESKRANKKATVAMARTNAPDSATRQFFINYVDNAFLNKSARSAGYAVFGEVTEGFEVIEAMAKQPTGRVGHYQDVPKTPIVITKVTRLK